MAAHVLALLQSLGTQLPILVLPGWLHLPVHHLSRDAIMLPLGRTSAPAELAERHAAGDPEAVQAARLCGPGQAGLHGLPLHVALLPAAPLRRRHASHVQRHSAQRHGPHWCAMPPRFLQLIMFSLASPLSRPLSNCTPGCNVPGCVSCSWLDWPWLYVLLSCCWASLLSAMLHAGFLQC